jgi:hypothetical protein
VKTLAIAVLLALAGSVSPRTEQIAVPQSIEGRWTLSTGQFLVGSIPDDLVISVDNGRIYGMLGDFQIRGTVRGGEFSFAANWPEHPLTVGGAVQGDGTLGGTLTLTSSPASDGTRLKKNASWTAMRAGRR